MNCRVIEMDEVECPHFGRVLTFPGECTKCSGKEDREHAIRTAVQFKFPAKYQSLLACGHFSTIGELICKRVDDTYVCDNPECVAS